MGVAIVGAVGKDGGFAAGSPAKGEFHCTGCGYGVVVRRVLPACPMCQGGSWQPWAEHRPTDLDVVDTRL